MTLTPAREPYNVIFVPVDAWGHYRPQLVLMFSLLALDPQMHATFLCPPAAAPNVRNELKSPLLADTKQPGPDGAPPKIDRLQVISCTQQAEFEKIYGPDARPEFLRDMREYLGWLWTGKGGEAGKMFGQENRFAGMRCAGIIPDAWLFELFQVYTETFEALGLPKPPVLSLQTFPPSMTLSAWASSKHGGFAAVAADNYDAARRDGLTYDEAVAKANNSSNAQVFKIAGHEPMYGYELKPMDAASPQPPPFIYVSLVKCRESYHPAIDCVLSTAVPEWNIEQKHALQEAYKQEALMVGYQFPQPVWRAVAQGTELAFARDSHEAAMVSGSLANDRPLVEWLGQRAPRSVAFVSFGSAAYPYKRPELVSYFIDSLLDAGFHVLLALASVWAQDDTPRFAKYDSDDRVHVSRWVPQWRVLHDPALAFFVTHCGNGSSSEALMALMPIVAVPLYGDQPFIADILCNKLRVGLELHQCKSMRWPPDMPQDRPFVLHRGVEIVGTEQAIKDEMNGVWKRMVDEGDDMRARLRELRDGMYESYVSGDTRKAMERTVEILQKGAIQGVAR